MTERVVEKRVLGKTVAIALGITCIILAVGLVGVIAYYINTMAAKNSEISDLQSQVDSLIDDKSDLNAIINLAKSTIWVNSQTISQPASNYTYWAFTASYAGYVSVNVESSTATTTYVEVIWYAEDLSYDEKIIVGTSGTAVFPVLPASMQIRVGNTNWFDGATETVTVTYHY